MVVVVVVVVMVEREVERGGDGVEWRGVEGSRGAGGRRRVSNCRCIQSDPATPNQQYTKPPALRPVQSVTHHGPIPHLSSILSPTFLLFCRVGPDRGLSF